MPNLSTPEKARDHARAMGATLIPNMPTIPPSLAKNLPSHISPADLLWDETLFAGEYASRILKRGTRIRLTNLEGDANLNLLALNADHPQERLNIADTVKVQWNAYLSKDGGGKLLLSDMGRVLLSILDDTSTRHDTFCGPSTEKTNTKKYGTGANHSPTPNARDRFLIALLKHGLGKKDIAPSLNLFKTVKIHPDGSTHFQQHPPQPNEYVELRAEMNTLLILANTPHVLDPRPTYTTTPIRITAWRAPITPESDPLRTATPESLRAYQNTEDYYNT